MDVLVTGAHGTVGSAVREHLGDERRYAFTWLDVRDQPSVETLVADVRDRAALRDAFAGQDAVVHLALNPDLNWRVTDVAWTPALEEHLRGIVATFGAAVEAGVETVVFASSVHVVGMVERERERERARTGACGRETGGGEAGRSVDRDSPARPDSMYAVAKLFGEALARFCAEYHGVRCYCLRLGAVLPAGRDHPYAVAERAVEAGDVERGTPRYDLLVDRIEGTWCSRRDVARLVDCCLRDEAVEFDVFYGVSDNAEGWVTPDHAREVLGYDPRDDAAAFEGPP